MGGVLQAVGSEKEIMPNYIFSKGKIQVRDGIYSPAREKAKRLSEAGVLIIISVVITCKSNADRASNKEEIANEQRQN